MKITNRKKYLIKNTTIFAISNISTKIIMFFLVPLYTRKLSVSDYGIVDLFFTIGSFLYPLLTLNIVEAVFRFSMDKNKDDSKIIFNGTVCNILCILLGTVIMPITKCFNGYSDYALLFYVYIISLAISQTLLAFLKGQEKLKIFSVGNILNVSIIAMLSFIFLQIFDLSIPGYFLAYITANIITSIYCILFGKIKISLSKKNFDKKLFKNMLKYSIVLVPTSFMWWIVNSSDRIMIASFLGESANGLYAISYKIPSLLTMVASIFNQAWVFSAINEKDSTDYEKYTNSIFKKLSVTLAISAIGILSVLKIVFAFYVSPEFFEAWKYVPPLILGYIFMTLSTFLSTPYSVHKDSRGFLISGTVGAIANIVLNFILIPPFGIFGAAIATASSYLAVYIYRLIDTRKYIQMHFSFDYILLLLAVIISCIATYFDSFITIPCCTILLLLIFIRELRAIKKHKAAQ